MHETTVQIPSGLKINYLDFGGEGMPLLLTHGLTANAHAFDGLMAAGLTQHHHVISLDLRGRGKSDKPETGYQMRDHVADVVAVMDELGLGRVILGGHSFGAFLTIFLAAHHPERVEKLILMDAAARLHPDTPKLLGPTLSRLSQKYNSFDQYLAQIKSLPFLEDAWDDQMTSYYRADVKDLPDGGVAPRAHAAHIEQALKDPLEVEWLALIRKIKQPTLFINALGGYGAAGAPPLVPQDLAQETVQALSDCQYLVVDGNHQTMLYGEGAKQIVAAIQAFI
ncbi:MAG: alpha/beta fold hydrolase [Bernardetiaceae bacterium]